MDDMNLLKHTSNGTSILFLTVQLFIYVQLKVLQLKQLENPVLGPNNVISQSLHCKH